MVKHYEPLRTFLVTRIERWTQLVEVQARTGREAVLRVKDGDGNIHEDPEFHSFTDSDTWDVEEVSNDPYREVSE